MPHSCPLQFQIFRVSGAALNDQLLFRSIIKSACIVAGLQGKPVILYIVENLCKEGLKDIAALIAYGGYFVSLY